MGSPVVPLVFATFQNIAKRYPPPLSWFESYSLRRAAARYEVETASPNLVG